MDAIDTALVEINDNNLVVLQYRQYPIPSAVQTAVRKITVQTSLEQITELDVILGELFADAVSAILALSGLTPAAITATGSHGQTVMHLPTGPYPRTLQIGDPARIAVKTGITTVADFRRNDIAAGGQGAPLACAFHAWRFRSAERDRVVLNLGGMANITVLPARSDREITGFDTGPGNALMDSWIQLHQQCDFDTDGAWAASGKVDLQLLGLMLADYYFSKRPPKSTGKDDFNTGWLASKLNMTGRQIEPANVQATLLELTARSISTAIAQNAAETTEILVCGGGVHNRALLQRLKEYMPDRTIVPTDNYGVSADAVEAVTFAWLAKCRLEQLPANIPAVTGASRQVILGAIYCS